MVESTESMSMSDEKLAVNQMPTPKNPVLFFDGVCGLCNRFVNLLFLIDRQKVFKVATLQGQFASRSLPRDITERLNSLVVLSESGEILIKSRAVLFILGRMGGIWRLLGFLGSLLPAVIADGVYDVISKNRYKAFGQLDACRAPTADEKCRFLD
jgi:predicted DCC family thiol-disulfide oxidoreductase YuxK